MEPTWYWIQWQFFGLHKGSHIVAPPIVKLQQYLVPPPGGLFGPWHPWSRQIILVWMILTYGKNSSGMGFHNADIFSKR